MGIWHSVRKQNRQSWILLPRLLAAGFYWRFPSPLRASAPFFLAVFVSPGCNPFGPGSGSVAEAPRESCGVRMHLPARQLDPYHRKHAFEYELGLLESKVHRESVIAARDFLCNVPAVGSLRVLRACILGVNNQNCTVDVKYPTEPLRDPACSQNPTLCFTRPSVVASLAQPVSLQDAF